MEEGHVMPESEDREVLERERLASVGVNASRERLVADRGADHDRDLELCLAGTKAVDDLAGDRVGNRAGASELLDLGLVLDPSEATDLGAHVHHLSRRGSGDQRLGGLEAQMVFLDADLGAPFERGPNQRVGVLAIAPRNDLCLFAIPARLLPLDRGNDERRAIRPDGQRHQPLERLSVKAGEVGDRNGLGDVGRVQIVPRHPGAKVLQRSRGGGATQCPQFARCSCRLAS